jgi:hypothetical protein
MQSQTTRSETAKRSREIDSVIDDAEPRKRIRILPNKLKRKREQAQDSSSKRARKSPVDIRSVKTILSKENLERLQRDMEPDRRKRAISRQTSFSDMNQDTASVRSQKSTSNASYRYNVLESAGMYIRPEPPPKKIQPQLDVIFKHKISDKRRGEISTIADEISQKFIKKTRGAYREDDLVEIFDDAFSDMFDTEIFTWPRKAGTVLPIPFSPLTHLSFHANHDIDWNPDLKPEVNQGPWDFNALDSINEATSARPSKRQQADLFLPSPNTSQSNLLLPADTVPAGAVKTPRPDFTIGLNNSAIASELLKHGMSEYQAENFLAILQRQKRLYSDPTQNYLNIRFPILVLEGKAYATGRPIFEAQNQAVVSGSCMVNLFQRLNTLLDRSLPKSKSMEIPLIFSICTEGPSMEFWVHYSQPEKGIYLYYMNLLGTCHGSLKNELEPFFLRLEHVMTWYKNYYLPQIAERLAHLAKRIER